MQDSMEDANLHGLLPIALILEILKCPFLPIADSCFAGEKKFQKNRSYNKCPILQVHVVTYVQPPCME